MGFVGMQLRLMCLNKPHTVYVWHTYIHRYIRINTLLQSMQTHTHTNTHTQTRTHTHTNTQTLFPCINSVHIYTIQKLLVPWTSSESYSRHSLHQFIPKYPSTLSETQVTLTESASRDHTSDRTHSDEHHAWVAGRHTTHAALAYCQGISSYHEL